MKKDNFVLLASLIFLILGVVDIARLLIGWQVQISGFLVPMWIYWIEAFIFLILAFVGFRLKKSE